MPPLCPPLLPSAPSAPFTIPAASRPEVLLLEYDTRFEATAGESYLFYDYNKLESLPKVCVSNGWGGGGLRNHVQAI